MKIVEPSAEIMTVFNGEEILKHLELCGRVCYKSEDKITADSAKKFIKRILLSGHESVIEHYSFTVRFICNRGVSHEIVRHRIASYSQESTRYVCYKDDDIAFIRPSFGNKYPEAFLEWRNSCKIAEANYKVLLSQGLKAQDARSVLPNSLKTEVIMTANLREWRHFFKLRTSPAAHPEMREIAIPLLQELKSLIPVVFDDIIVDIGG